MSIYITKGDGTTDTGEVVTSVDATYMETTAGANVLIDAYVHETDSLLPNRTVSATIEWNDGKLSTSFPKTSGGLLHATAVRLLPPGSYIVRLTAQNFRTPVEDRVAVNYFITVNTPTVVSDPQRYVYGPILPRDSGFPNASQWEFQLDSDQRILESAVKMLLLTSKGDRVMEPTYGTNIRRILFESQLSGIDSLIQDEVISALAMWEPRVELGSVSLQRGTNDRSVTLNLVLLSRLSKQSFETSVEYVG